MAGMKKTRSTTKKGNLSDTELEDEQVQPIQPSVQTRRLRGQQAENQQQSSKTPTPTQQQTHSNQPKNNFEKISTPKQEDITSYMKEEVKPMRQTRSRAEEPIQINAIDRFFSPIKEIGKSSVDLTQLSLSQRSTPNANGSGKSSATPLSKLKPSIESKILFKSTEFTPAVIPPIVAGKSSIQSKAAISTSTPVVNKRKWKVGLSGFAKQTKELNKNAISDLGGEYTETMSKDVSVVVAYKALSLSTKYCWECGIPVVRSEWISASLKARKFIDDVENYRILGLEGCRLNVLGFTEAEFAAIKSRVIEYGGDCENDLNQASKPPNKSANENTFDLTVVNSKMVTSNNYMNTIKSPFVNEKWLAQTFARNIFVFPKHYIINKIDLSKYSIENENVIAKMRSEECSSQEFSYLNGCTIFIHSQNLDDRKQRVISYLITLGGGFFVRSLLPCVTHIVTPHYTKLEYGKLTQYGNSVSLVHPEWLLDCFNVQRKLEEIDYQPTQIENPVLSSVFSDSSVKSQRNFDCFSQQSNSQLKMMSESVNSFNLPSGQRSNRQSIASAQGFFGGLMRQSSVQLSSIEERQENNLSQSGQMMLAKSQSTGSDKKTKKMNFKVQKSLATIKGNVFKNCVFYLEWTQYKEKLNQYKMKIFENQGDILSTVDHLKYKEIFHILNDKPENDKIIDKSKTNVFYYSYRWIDFCIEKKNVIRNVQDLQLIHLLPFHQVMPLQDFLGVSVYCSGYEPNEKIAIRSTIIIIGATYEFTPGKTAYLVCENADCSKMRFLQEEKASLSSEEYQARWGQLKIVSAIWILECVSTGGKADLQTQ